MAWFNGPECPYQSKWTARDAASDHFEEFYEFFRDYVYAKFPDYGDLVEKFINSEARKDVTADAEEAFLEDLHDRSKCECQSDAPKGHFSGCDPYCVC